MDPIPAPDIERCRQEWPATSFLGQISESAATRCFANGQFVRYGARETLIQQHAADSWVYLLMSGCVKVVSELDGAHRCALLGIRAGGDVVGELTALDGRRRSATVQVCGRQPVVACAVEGPKFLAALAHHPDALRTLAIAVVLKLRAATRRRIDFLSCTPTMRMARALLELAEDHGTRLTATSVMIGLDLKQVELGTLVGVREATAQRALRELREAGLIVTSQRRPIIRDIEALRAEAGVDEPTPIN